MPTATAATSVTPPDDPSWQHQFVHVNGVRLHYVQAGSGPLVVLLHGFPEFWYAWRRQIPALAAAGFRVIAPDLRGYGLSDKPAPVEAYGLGSLVEDVRALIESTGARRASVVGHDVGAVVAWALAMQHPERVDRVCILNGPHPVRMLRGLLNPLQLVRSWYIFFFQLPQLPERVARRNDFELLLEPFARIPARRGWAPHELDAYRRAFEVPGALSAMINGYRAPLRGGPGVRPRPVDAPVYVLWGDRDPYLRRSLAHPGERWAPRARVEHLPHAGHFVQHEAPDLVNARLVAFLSEEAVSQSEAASRGEGAAAAEAPLR